MSDPAWGFGPAWARNTQCCGKPVGCTNMSDQCQMLNHRWKKWHRAEFGTEVADAPEKPEEDGNEPEGT